MKLKLKNIGTLKQAEIDLSKDLIILAGPNNTGKTYAAYTVYGVCDLLRKAEKLLLTEKHDTITSTLGLALTELISNFSKNSGEVNVNNYIDEFVIAVSESFNKQSSHYLRNIFATDETQFLKSEIEIFFNIDELKAKMLDFPNSIHKGSTSFSFTYKNYEISKPTGDDKVKYEQIGETKDNKSNSIEIYFEVEKYLSSTIIDFYFKNIYINTAERSAINIFSKELSIKRNNIVEELLEIRDSKNGDANQILKKLQRYPLPIRDSLAIAEDLANLSRNKSEYGFLANSIEEVLLDGRITTSKEGEVQYSPNKSKAKNLSIHLTASIVKSLSNLVFYFRHLAQKGDFIIIDEPELNLHPDNQRKVARLIGEIINHGFKVMISTHSDYIIREINNLIMLKSGGEKAKPLIDKYEYKEIQLIDYQKIGAYLFKNNRNTLLEVTETGFEVNTIDEEINNLNNASEEIFFTLFD